MEEGKPYFLEAHLDYGCTSFSIGYFTNDTKHSHKDVDSAVDEVQEIATSSTVLLEQQVGFLLSSANIGQGQHDIKLEMLLGRHYVYEAQ